MTGWHIEKISKIRKNNPIKGGIPASTLCQLSPNEKLFTRHICGYNTKAKHWSAFCGACNHHFVVRSSKLVRSSPKPSKNLINNPKLSHTLPSTPKLFQTLPSTPKCSQMLTNSNNVKHYPTLPNSIKNPKYSHCLPLITKRSKHFQTLPSTPKHSLTLPNSQTIPSTKTLSQTLTYLPKLNTPILSQTLPNSPIHS